MEIRHIKPAGRVRHDSIQISLNKEELRLIRNATEEFFAKALNKDYEGASEGYTLYLQLHAMLKSLE